MEYFDIELHARRVAGRATTKPEVFTAMDYTAFWNIVPSLALFILTLGMTGFVVMDFASARTAAAEPAAAHGTDRAEEALAA
jgi:hypothetical protein